MQTIPRIKRFQTGDRLYVQAQRIWLILVAFVMSSDRRAKHPARMTYGELAIRMGYPSKRAGHMLARQLGIVGTYCVLNDLPALNSIVVNEETQQPGDEVVLRPGRSVRQEQADIMREDWFTIRVPTTGTFRKVWQSL